MWNVREISAEDILAVADLEREIFPDPWSVSALQETFSQNHTVMLGVWEENHMAGYVIAYYVLDEGEIARIAISQRYRRQGAAGQLLCALGDFCSANGIQKLMLEVRESNVAARTFYRKWGFTEDGIRRNYYEDPQENGILMSKGLSEGPFGGIL